MVLFLNKKGTSFTAFLRLFFLWKKFIRRLEDKTWIWRTQKHAFSSGIHGIVWVWCTYYAAPLAGRAVHGGIVTGVPYLVHGCRRHRVRAARSCGLGPSLASQCCNAQNFHFSGQALDQTQVKSEKLHLTKSSLNPFCTLVYYGYQLAVNSSCHYTNVIALLQLSLSLCLILKAWERTRGKVHPSSRI